MLLPNGSTGTLKSIHEIFEGGGRYRKEHVNGKGGVEITGGVELCGENYDVRTRQE